MVAEIQGKIRQIDKFIHGRPDTIVIHPPIGRDISNDLAIPNRLASVGFLLLKKKKTWLVREISAANILLLNRRRQKRMELPLALVRERISNNSESSVESLKFRLTTMIQRVTPFNSQSPDFPTETPKTTVASFS